MTPDDAFWVDIANKLDAIGHNDARAFDRIIDDASRQLHRRDHTMTGTIARLNREKGFGFIEVAGSRDDYFFHRSALLNTTFDKLTEGQSVTFEAGRGDKGLRAESVSA